MVDSTARLGTRTPLTTGHNNNNNNNNITIYKAHNVRKKLNLRRRQSLGGGKSNSV